MKCVILAGGKGTRIAEESSTRPKPMLEIGAQPGTVYQVKGNLTMNRDLNQKP